MNWRLVRWLAGGLTLAMLAGAAGLAWYLRERDAEFFSDSGTIRTAAEAAVVRDILWESPRDLGPSINTAGSEHEPFLTGDGMTLLFVRGRAGRDTDILQSSRTSEGWTEPERLSVNSAADELGPVLTPDGGTLFFHSNRGGGLGGYDLWSATREGDGWSSPVNLGDRVNTPYHEYGVSVTPDGQSIYFASNRPGAEEETAPAVDAGHDAIRRDMASRDWDLYESAITPGGVLPADPLVALNSDYDEGSPAVSPAGDFVYFGSDRPAGLGGFDLYRARRSGDGLHEPVNLGPQVNTAANEMDPVLALGGFDLYFSSDRDALAFGRDPGSHDLYRSRSREVFREIESYRATIDWMALLAALLRPFTWLLLALLAIVFLMLLFSLMDQQRFRRLSLLARCLLASLLVHMLLMLALTFWTVSSSISDMLKKGRGTRVALVTSSSGSELQQQLRAGLADLSFEAAPSTDSPQEFDVERQPTDATASMAVEQARLDPTRDAEQAVVDDAAATPSPEPPVESAAPAPVEVAVDVPAAATRERAAEAQQTFRHTDAPATARASAERSPHDAGEQQPNASAVVEPAAVATRGAARLADATVRDAEAEKSALEPVDTAAEAPQRSGLQMELQVVAESPAAPSSEAATPLVTRLTSAERSSEASATARGQQQPGVDVTPESVELMRESESLARSEAAEATVPSSALTDERITQQVARDKATFEDLPLPAADVAPFGSQMTEAVAHLASAASSAPRAATASPGNVVTDAETRVEVAPVVEAGRIAADGIAAMNVEDAVESERAPMSLASRSDAMTPADVIPVDLPTAADGQPAMASVEEAQAASTTPTMTLRRGALPSAATATSATGQSVAMPVTGAAAPATASSMAPMMAAEAAAPTGGAAPATTVTSVQADAPIEVALTVPAGVPGASGGEIRVSRDARPARAARAAAAMTPSTGPVMPVDVPVGPGSSAAPTEALASSVVRDAPDRGSPASRTPSGAVSGVPSPPEPDLGALETELPATVVAVLGEREAMESVPTVETTRRAPASWRPTESQPETAPMRVPSKRVPLALEHHRFTRTARPAPATDRPETPRDLVEIPVERLALAASPDLDLKLPEMTKMPPNPFAQRAPEVREQQLERMGGTQETEEAVRLALDWLARHQSPDGHWDSRGFDEACRGCGDPSRVESNIGLTGLSLMCFLAAGHSHVEEGPYREQVARAIDWLLRAQKPDGNIIGGESMYSHGIASMAMAEAYAMSNDERLAGPVRDANDFIYEARNQHVGGWRYAPGQAGDTSVMGWQIMSLISARRAGLVIPQEAFEVGRDWLSTVSRASRPGRYAYQPGKRFSPAMSAEGMYVQQLLGRDRDDPWMQASATYLLDNPPLWDEDPNTYYWYYATLALFQHGGAAWSEWNEQIKSVLLEHQHQSGRMAGSWEPDGRWARIGGRVYQTAICTLTLEVYYRYLPLYVTEGE